MGLHGEGLRGFFYSSPKGTDGDVRKMLGVKLIKGEPMRQHIDDLGNANAGAFDGQFTTGAIRSCFKVFHSLRIVASRSEKVNLINWLYESILTLPASLPHT
jgi:hypothetical protein